MKIAILDYDNTISDGYSRYELGYAMEREGLIKKGLREEVEELEGRYLNGEITYNQKFSDDKKIFSKYYKGVKRLDIIRFLHQDFDLALMVFPWTEELINMLRDNDYLIVIISGSWDFILEEAQVFLDFDSFFGSEFRIENGELTDQYARIMDHEQKRIATQQILQECEHSIGIGDSAADFVFLDQVDEPFLYAPLTEARNLAKGKGYSIVDEGSILDEVKKKIQ
jgi:HAD superfamily phosphoserine phosphatase-like hydrolase